MPMTIPQTVQDALGEKPAQDLANWIDQVLKERTVVRGEYREVLSRLDLLEHDVAGLKDGLHQLRTEMNERFDHMNERFDTLYDRMLVQTRWTVGTIALFGTAVTILLAIAQFKP